MDHHCYFIFGSSKCPHFVHSLQSIPWSLVTRCKARLWYAARRIHGNSMGPHGNPRHGGLGWAGDNLIWNGVGWSKKKTYLLWIGLGMGWILAFTTHTLCHRLSINKSLLCSPTRERVHKKKSAPRRMLRLVYKLMNMFMKCCVSSSQLLT